MINRNGCSQPQNQDFDSWQLGFKGSTDGVLYEASMKTHGAPEAFVKAATVNIVEAKEPGGAAEPVRVYTNAREKLTVKGLASYAGVSQKTLERIF